MPDANQQSRQTRTFQSLLEPVYHHTWYIGFGVGTDVPRWQQYFCTPEWSHVFCFAQLGPVVQVVNPCRSRTEIGVRASDDGSPLDAIDFAKEVNDKGFSVLRITHAPEKILYRSIWIPNCVSFVKVVIGYNTGWMCYNPWKFFNHLLNNGAELIYA